MTTWNIIEGDCRETLKTLGAESVDAIVTDPPYGLSFMGKDWDHGVPGAPFWSEALRVAKPGAYLVAFGGTRTYHRLTCAIEDAGWQIRDCIMWLYGSGFPKGQGCLKPAWEPIILARKKGPKVLPLNIDECRVACQPIRTTRNTALGRMNDDAWQPSPAVFESHTSGRWPANVIHDGSDEVLAAFPDAPGQIARARTAGEAQGNAVYGSLRHHTNDPDPRLDSGSAARFFYCAKASKEDRGPGNTHPTVKPLSLMSWLVRLVTPDGGLVLDPFAGSGSTGVVARRLSRRFVGCELNPEYAEMARKRIRDDSPLFNAPASDTTIPRLPDLPGQATLFGEEA